MTPHTPRNSRRSFMKKVALAGIAASAAPAILRAAGANEQKLRLAFIGTSGMGKTHVNKFGDLGVVCPCYCDVDTANWDNAKKRWPDAKGYQDYREMLTRHENDFDAVAIAIPDHSHFLATLMAMKMGKSCYTQKPLTQTVWEARQLTELAAKNPKLTTQMGNQGHAGEGWRIVYSWIRNGAIGDVKEVHNWTNRPIWPQGQDRPKGEDKVPETLNWDLWIGPAPMRPYKKDTYHTFKWRGWFDFGAGALGDMACHTMDGMFWALDAGYPTSVEPIAAPPNNGDSFPNYSAIKWQFPAKNGRPAFTAFWYDGGLRPAFPPELAAANEGHFPKTGNLFVGTKGAILVAGDYGDSPRLIPESLQKEVGKPQLLIPKSPGHYEEFVAAASGQEKPSFAKSDFSYAGPMSEAILLGNVALRTNRRLDWDGPGLKVTNVEEANKYIKREYRKGWEPQL